MAVECDKCGACCCSFPVYASEADASAEPKIKERGVKLDKWLGDNDWRYQLHPLPFLNACTFLGLDNLCSIYASRPGVCRKFEAGSPQCQEARKRMGLGVLDKAT